MTGETFTEGEKVTVYTYAYDNVSNRILKTENGAATEYVYNALNQLVSDSETSYEYDLKRKSCTCDWLCTVCTL